MYKPKWMGSAKGQAKQLKLWEIALAVGLAAAVCSSLWAGATQKELSGHLLRLHVVAPSDTEADQALKLQVRDRVLALADQMTRDSGSAGDAQAILQQQLPTLEAAARDEVRKQGYAYPVRAELAQTQFPTKTYDGFALPAGRYLALRVLIGEGQGQNWWCVVFPSLCMPSAAPGWQEAAATGGLSQEQIGLMSGADSGYVVKFQMVEWWDALCRFFTGSA